MANRSTSRRALLRAAALGLAGLALAAPELALARRGDGPSGARIGLDEAVAMVHGRYGGRILAASAGIFRGRNGYRIRVMTEDGRVYTVFVDAQSGAMSES